MNLHVTIANPWDFTSLADKVKQERLTTGEGQTIGGKLGSICDLLVIIRDAAETMRMSKVTTALSRMGSMQICLILHS